MKYGLIGESLVHSFSKNIHRELSDYVYNYYEVNKEELPSLLKKEAMGGFNVTIPYKQEVIKYCNSLSPSAKKIGSVNTLVYDKNRAITGYNTDYDGFIYLLKRSKIELMGASVLILGNGGTSLTARAAAADLGADKITIVSRKGPITYEKLGDYYDSTVIINTTPVGMYPNNGESLIDLSYFKKCKAVVDVIYNPLKTKLVLQAESLGIKATGGLPMLVAQARTASELFTGEIINDNKVEAIIKKLSKEKENIVLVGMPGSGKSTIGAALAKATGKELIETDLLVEEHEGKTIPEIFEEKGEAYFREVEKAMVASAGKRSGAIISTGGGVILNKENLDPLRQNGQIYFIQRPIESLSRDGRPLSKSTEALKDMYKIRLPLYKSFSNTVVNNYTTITEAAEEIIKDFNKSSI
ncbi:shikimate kinase [Alloiococcus sp. CFN-8]|uniref:shikimate kinase n=1 Tax=Alloiococcus sp. CFN-8 TaxID=3416081 RepID=UPI003CF324DD